MIGELSNELYRLIATYRNRAGLFRWNGNQPSFSMRDVVSHHLFAKAEASGFTPVPNVKFHDWTFDMMCLRGTRVEIVFLVRQSVKEDYRGLLLFPKTIEKVLIALTKGSVPLDTEGFRVIRIPTRPTKEINASLSPQGIVADYFKAFKEIYGFSPSFTYAQLIGAAAKISRFWMANAADLNFREFAVWFLAQQQAANARAGIDRITQLNEFMNKIAIDSFRLNKTKEQYDGKWTTGGWDALDS